jgi:phosphoglycerol transferase MdoB-like AlkP superfamily enzyme
LILSTLTALAWIIVYLLIIRRGHLEKTYGIPLVVLAIDVSWEFIFTFVLHPAKMDADAWFWIGVNATWLVIELVILIQAIKYGTRENWPSTSFFYGAVIASLVFGFAGVLAFTFQFQDWEGQWTVFADNLMMSILFINMLYQRGIRGQSIYIAFFKLAGTLAIGVSYLVTDPGSPLQWYLTLSILFFDALYIVLLYRKIRAAAENPWTRL